MKPWPHCKKVKHPNYETCPLWAVGGHSACICHSAMMTRADLARRIGAFRHGNKDALAGMTLKGAREYLRRLRRIG